MKRIFLGVFVVMLLCGCHPGMPEQKDTGTEEMSCYIREWTGAGEDQILLQKNLARWYNWNIREYDAGEFTEAYNRILFYSGGVLGWAEVGDISLPIYHGPGTRNGFSHDPQSSFPIGQKGDHAVLITTADIQPEVGECFFVHILDDVYVYEVQAVRKRADTSRVAGVDYCSLIGRDGTQFLGIRRTEGEH